MIGGLKVWLCSLLVGRRLCATFQLCGSKGVAAYDGHAHTHASRHVYYTDKSLHLITAKSMEEAKKKMVQRVQ